MKITRRNKTILSTAFLLVYIFVAFFATNFHHHGSGLVFKDFQFKNSDISVKSAPDLHKEFTDCLSCHLLHDGKTLIPQDFSFQFISETFFHEQLFAYSQRFSAVLFHTLQLRGPPAVFI